MQDIAGTERALLREPRQLQHGQVDAWILVPREADVAQLAGLLRLEQRERALVEYQEYLRLDPKGEFAAATRELVTKLAKVIVESKKSLN